MQILPFETPIDDGFAAESAAEAIENEMIERLCKLLLNPELDRCDITDGILGDRDLIQFLCGCKEITLEKKVPPGGSWAEIQRCDLHWCYITRVLGETGEEFVMPMLLGCLLHDNGRPWFQASPHEFIPAAEGIKTTNLYGKPMFRADKGGLMSISSISAKEKFSHGIFQCSGVC